MFINAFNKEILFDWHTARILDPCAGGNRETRKNGKITNVAHDMSYPNAIHNATGVPIDLIDTYDIREDSLAVHTQDYLKADLPYKPNMIITNPPFNMATQIIEKAIHDVADNGYVVMLLRLNFFGSIERFPFFQKYLPEWCFVHHKRIGFTDKKDTDGYVLFDKDMKPRNGSTDSIEYCHMVFRKTRPAFTKLVVI